MTLPTPTTTDCELFFKKNPLGRKLKLLSLHTQTVTKSASTHDDGAPRAVTDTPLGKNSSRGSEPHHLVSEIKDDLFMEFRDKAWVIPDDNFKEMVDSTTPKGRLESFIKEHLKKYGDIPTTSQLSKRTRPEGHLYTPFFEFIKAILQYFKLDTREIVICDTCKLSHDERHSSEEVVENEAQSSVDLMVAGSCDEFDHSARNRSKKGTSKVRESQREISYRTCLIPIEVKHTKSTDSEVDLFNQAAMYARSCLNAQRNRNFIYVIMLNEESARLYYFDHCGALVSNWLSFRDDPTVLVSLIVKACKLRDRSSVGLDPDVSFKPRYLPGDPPHVTRSTTGAGPATEFDRIFELNLIEGDNVIRRRSLIATSFNWSSNAVTGRKTICWIVKDKDVSNDGGKEYILKQCSVSVDRKREWDLLSKAKGVEGVGQMIGYQASKSFSQIRQSVGMVIPTGMNDRQRYSLLLEMHGPPIYKFTSPLQLLTALRDAINGHRGLWEREILHRDISNNNILLGKPGAKKGSRGILIDLDLAIDISRKNAQENDERTGTHAFKSYIALSNMNTSYSDFPYPQDYLDDLESFFWVFFSIVLGYSVAKEPSGDYKVTIVKEGRGRQSLDNFMCNQNGPVSVAYTAKRDILRGIYPGLAEGWPSIFNTLTRKIIKFLAPKVNIKEDIRGQINENEIHKDDPTYEPSGVTWPAELTSLKDAAKEDYTTFLKLFDDAIESLEQEAEANKGPVMDIFDSSMGSGATFRITTPLEIASP